MTHLPTLVLAALLCAGAAHAQTTHPEVAKQAAILVEISKAQAEQQRQVETEARRQALGVGVRKASEAKADGFGPEHGFMFVGLVIGGIVLTVKLKERERRVKDRHR